MYTELIFGADLKKDTPKNVIEALKYMIGDTEEKPNDFPLPEGRCEFLFRGTSCYFGVSMCFSDMVYDTFLRKWIVSTRSNIKNYGGEIEAFLKWIKPYIESGSGNREMYAIVTYEGGEPEIYYLYE